MSDLADCPVVGIGASAGGLEVLKRFLHAMPADSGAAFVLIQHLDPHHESLTAEILTRCTTMAVVQVDAPMPVQPNTVYVIPPNAYLCLRDNTLHLSKPVLQHGLRMPVDNFFRSLAEERRERAIGLIVSGTGSDGTLGIKALKAYGGLVIAQSPESAQYDGMPRSAIATGLVDIVCPIESVPDALGPYLQHAYVREPDHPQELLAETEDFRTLLALLQAHTGYDFRPYKKGTLGRRIARRMGLHHIESLADYVKLIRAQPGEATQLLNDLLIGVTAFFRDPEAFKVLDTQVLTPLINEKAEDAPLRVWTPGCASGEEAYSIAMLLTERLAASHRHNPVQVFATDIDETTLAIGRAGIYPRAITADVQADRLQRFFLRHDDSFQVSKSLRESVTFAQQNLIADPPFSKIDLISCRNLLIYLEPEMQARVIALFHFALNDGGYLFLGNAETIGQHASLFEPVSRKWRLYRRVGPTHPVTVDFPITRSRTKPSATGAAPALTSESARLAQIAQQALLNDYAPAAVLVNRKHQALYFYGPTSRYLNQPVGAPTSDLLNLVRDGLLTKLRAALHTAGVEQSTIHIDDARMNRDGSYVRVKLTVRPVVSGPDSEKLLLITFEDQSAVSAKDAERTDESHEPLVQQLEYELKATREDLQSHIEEQESSNEELQAANEEVMSVNEELQSTNEELETSKEELQSLNEELSTVNNQLKDKLEELEALNNDLMNLLSSTDIATVFLDRERRIKRFTPACKSLYSLVETDLGRAIEEIRPRFDDHDLIRDIKRVLDTLTPLQSEIRTQDGDWFLRRLLPYRTADHRIGGVVMTFVNISEHKLAEEQTRRLAAVVRDSNDAITVQDLDGQITSWNRGAEQMYGWSESEALTMNIAKLIPEGKRENSLTMVAATLRGASQKSIETQRLTKDGGTLDVWLTLTPMLDETGRCYGVATTERDITARKRMEAELRQREKGFRTLVAAAPDALLIVDESGQIRIANTQAEHLFGYALEEFQRLPVEQLMPLRFRSAHVAHRRDFFAAPETRTMGSNLELLGLHRDGREFPIEVNLSAIDMPEGPMISAAIRDVSDRVRVQDDLREQKAFSDSLIETAQAIVLLLDTEGRVVQINPYFEQLSGYRAAEIIGQDWFTTFLPEKEQPEIRTLFNEVMRTGFNPGYTNAILARNGTSYAIEWRAKTLTDARGKTVGLLNIGHDVTRRIKTERDLSASKRDAELADAAKSRFLAAASHDLRQPLQTISLLNEVLARTVDDPAALSAIEGQNEALRAIDGLLGAYLDMSKLEAGVIRPQVTRFRVDKLFRSLHAEFAPHAHNKGIALRTVDCSASIRSDPVLLQQILENLVGNAIKHTPPGGRVLFGARRRGDRVSLQVWDTGSGIPSSQFAVIFEDFMQLDNPERDRQKGLGLGLAIAQRIARLLGHRIDVRSRLGKGSVFEIEVLRTNAAVREVASTVTPETPPTLPGAGISLLLIEDDPSILSALRLLLESCGYAVTAAVSGEQALQLVTGAAQPLDLIISDYRLPDGENGLDIIDKVRTAIGRDLPAILMTGDTESKWLLEADKANCRVLHKPARADVLLPMMQELLP